MRQILMSKPGEFHYKSEKDQPLSAAVKMLAKVIGGSREDSHEEPVIVANKPSKPE